MKKYYFKAEKLRVGYGKQPLIENIEICLEKGEILDTDRAKWGRKIDHPKEYHKTACIIGRYGLFRRAGYRADVRK